MDKNELIAILHDIEGSPEVILASDEEGNSFQKLDWGCSIEKDSKGLKVLILWPNGINVDLE